MEAHGLSFVQRFAAQEERGIGVESSIKTM
jgi:hypothetical protein